MADDRDGAHNAVHRAVRAGTIPPVPTLACKDCGATAEHYHHEQGYSAEHFLDVVPLCSTCHGHRHTVLMHERDQQYHDAYWVSGAVLLKVEEVAERFRTTEETIRRWLRDGRIHGIRPGGTKMGWRIPESEVSRLIDGES